MAEIKALSDKVVTIEFTNKEIQILNDALENYEAVIPEARFVKHLLQSVKSGMRYHVKTTEG